MTQVPPITIARTESASVSVDLVGVVSAVIPTRDRPHYLREAIGSVLAQGACLGEAIVCDDGSNPPASVAIGDIADGRVRILRHATPVGIAQNWLSGLLAARRPWVALLPDDDVWDPSLLGVLLTHAADDVDIVFCETNLIDERGRYLESETRLADRYRKHAQLRPGRLTHDDFIRAAVAKIDVPLNGAIIRRTKLLPLLDEKAGTALDFDITARLALSGAQAVFVPFRGVRYRWHAGSLSRKTTSLPQQSVVRVNDALISAFPTMPSSARNALLARKRDALVSWAWLEIAQGNGGTARELLGRAREVPGRRLTLALGMLLSVVPPKWFVALRRGVIRARRAASLLRGRVGADGPA